MKIAQVVTGLSRANGVTVFVENITRELNALGHNTVIFTLAVTAPIDYRQFDLVHLHGLWHPWLHRQAVAARALGKKIVWSPHGMLTPWAFHYKWWKKLPAWYLYQKNDLKKSTLIHVTAESEVEDVRRVGLMNNVVIVPLGVSLPTEKAKASTVSHGGQTGMMKILYAGRVAKIKNLDRLIRATSMMPSNEWRLRLVGPDQEGHTAELELLARELGIRERIDFVGPKYRDELSKEYAAADCFILPSHSENFGSVVLEALAAGTPVIASRGTPWKILEDAKCGYWVENDPASLSVAIMKMMKLSAAERMEMGLRGQNLVIEKYTWKAVGAKLAAAYQSLFS